MSEATARTLSINRKKRGVVRASITRLRHGLANVEGQVPPDPIEIRRLTTRLQTLAAEFKVHHYAIIELLDDETALETEQDTLDDHEDGVAQLTGRMEKLLATCSGSDSGVYKIATKRLKHVDDGIAAVFDAISNPLGDDAVCLLQQYQEQLTEFKSEHSSVRTSLLSYDVEDTSDLSRLLVRVEKGVFDCSLQIKKLLRSHATPSSTPSSTPDSSGVKLPKLDVPTFDGNLLNWKMFWEQFTVSVHVRSNLTDAEKLAYLRHALKDGSAKSVVEGLSRSGDHYDEAITCLKTRYDRPRLIHQAHVRKIIEIPSLKDGSGKELRRLHDTAQQHLRALKALGHDPSGSFITSLLELKLDVNTMFEWQRHSQASADVPHFKHLLEFINLRAQASEASVSDAGKKFSRNDTNPPTRKGYGPSKPVASFVASAESSGNCVLCKSIKHPLYCCPKFKSLSHEDKLSTVRTNGMCINCMRSGHFVRNCRSSHRCSVCQKPHHTLLHIENKEVARCPSTTSMVQDATPAATPAAPITTSHVATGIKSEILLMTCRVRVEAQDGSTMEARAMLDSGSSASFISEHLAQSLRLPRTSQNTRISGVAGFVRNSTQPITSFIVSSTLAPARKLVVSAVIVPRVTCDLPLHPIPFDDKWSHIAGLQLADPEFGQPGRIDLLLGVEVFAEVVLQGRRLGSPGSPIAFDTQFGWVLAGSTKSCTPAQVVVSHHTALLTGDDLLRRFWEVEEKLGPDGHLTQEEKLVLDQFKNCHTRLENGRFMVPLPKKSGTKPLGESRSQAVRRFVAFEHSLHRKSQFPEFKAVIDEYFESGHAEAVPEADLNKPPHSVFYLPMHVVRKSSSTTTKVRAVFDASAKTSSGVSLNDTLLVGPTVHSSLVDVLLRFRQHRVALVADVSRMYRAIALTDADKDLHRFVWRSSPSDSLKDYRMTRVTFGVSASSFVSNMCVKQNALDLSMEFPLAARAVEDSFYVDDGLTGADSIEEAIDLHSQLQGLFDRGGFLLRKWNSSELEVLQHIDPELREQNSVLTISDPDEYSKTLGIEWNSTHDQFRLAVADLPPQKGLTKRILTSDIARTFDVLGWVSPVVVKAKILLQRMWEVKVQWDDPVPQELEQTWQQWRAELSLLADRHIPRCYFPKDVTIAYRQLHGFSDASEQAYSGVVYLRLVDTTGCVHISLVIAKTRVAPIKRLTIPRLELCGAHLLSQLLRHCQVVLDLPSEDIFAWTDSTIVLNWLVGNPRRFKTFVGNRVSSIIDSVPPNHWNHVDGVDNPADCASRGMFPSELLSHNLWWRGPSWLQLGIHQWPKLSSLPPNPSSEADEICSHAAVVSTSSLIPLGRYSSYSRLVRVTSWVLRFVHNCRAACPGSRHTGPLSVVELSDSRVLWLSTAQYHTFSDEIESLKSMKSISKSSCLRTLHPFLDKCGILRVGGRLSNSEYAYSRRHPVILHGRHELTALIIRAEHVRLLHAGPSLVNSSLSRQFHIVGQRIAVRSITRACITCRRLTVRPQPQLMGQLPLERIAPGMVFENVGIDYAGPILLKLGRVRKPVIVKAYICVFVAVSVKAVHLEVVSDLTSEAFIACLRRFVARRGKPHTIWSDHGSNFVGASRELAELAAFLEEQRTQTDIPDFCASQSIRWSFIPERAPHFGGLWESAVKSMKLHLRRVVGSTRLTFEELTTVLTQVEACLNSRPLVSLPSDGDGVEALTPGHFLIGRPLEALPDPPSACQSITVLRRWSLCQALTRHFWKRWSTDYFASLRRFSKWHVSSRLETLCCCGRTASFLLSGHLVRSLLCTQAKINLFESSPYEPLLVPTRGQSSR